jgi:FlgN protein
MTPVALPTATKSLRTDELSPAGRQIAAMLRVLVEKQQMLEKVLDRQRNALIQGKLEAIDAANVDAETLLSDMERIDLERESLAVRISKVVRGDNCSTKSNPWSMEAETDSVKLDDLLPYFNEDVRQEIESPRQALKQLIPLTRRKLSANSALALNGSKIVHATLGILTTIVGREGPDKHQIYGAQGKTHYGRTQVRSLWNRKV